MNDDKEMYKRTNITAFNPKADESPVRKTGLTENGKRRIASFKRQWPKLSEEKKKLFLILHKKYQQLNKENVFKKPTSPRKAEKRHAPNHDRPQKFPRLSPQPSSSQNASGGEDEDLDTNRIKRIQDRAQNERQPTPPPPTDPEPDNGVLQTYKIIEKDVIVNEEMGTERHVIRVEVLLMDEDLGYAVSIIDVIESIIKGFSPEDFVGLRLENCDAYDIHIPFVRVHQFSKDMILHQFYKAAQSHREYFGTNKYTMEITRVHELEGRGGNNRFERNSSVSSFKGVFSAQNGKNNFFKDYLLEKKIPIDEHSVCLLFAVVCGMEFHVWCDAKTKIMEEDENEDEAKKALKKADARWRQARDQYGQEFAEKVIDLLEKVDENFEHGATTNTLIRVQDVLGEEYKIIVYNGRVNSRKVFGSDYEEGDEKRKKIFLYLDENKHFHTMKHPASLFGFRYFCQFCEKCINNPKHAKCKGSKCTKCEGYCKVLKHNEVETVVNMICSECNIKFKTLKCYTQHIDKKVCAKRKVCDTCGFLYIPKLLKKEDHTCFTRWCTPCGLYQPLPHYCYIKKAQQPKSVKEDDCHTFYHFADFECTQEERVFHSAKEKFRHKVNLVHVQTVCSACRNREITDDDTPCMKCGERGKTIHNLEDQNVNVVAELLDHMNEKCRPRTLANGQKMTSHDGLCMFHNGRGYDFSFILKELMTNTNWIVKTVIMNGLKIMKIEMINVHTKVRVKFLDFLNFLPFPLAAMPKNLKLEGDIVKGTFPHLFNRIENYQYDEKSLPDIKFYDPDNMSEGKRKELLDWHAEASKKLAESGETYNFIREIIAYCITDVDILRKSALKFRSFFVEYNIEPFLESLTIASLVSALYRRTDYRANTIGLLPKSESYRSSQSIEALKYLRWLEITKNIPHLQHAGNGAEKWLHGAPVDGFDETTNTVYNFDGCYWHFCSRCHVDVTAKSYGVKNFETGMARRQGTKARCAYLRSKGYKVVQMRECEWKRRMQRNPEMHKKLCDDPIVQRGYLISRSALFGGRTNAVNLYLKPDDSYNLQYYDFTSLYSTVNKYSRYPIGHPKVYTKDFPDILKVNGLVHCAVSPPGNLYHPVLPERVDGKLLFHLCSRCAREKKSIYCTHSANERLIRGMWTSYELILAIKFGYRIHEIYELWDYEKTAKYIPGLTRGLFDTFVDRFLKMKQEASGWPREGMTEAEKRDYIERFKEFENILLEYEKIEKNPVLRLLAKLCLNSLWGKFGERPDKPKTAVLNNRRELLQLLNAPNVEVKAIHDNIGAKLLVNYTDCESNSPNASSMVASITTSHARILLYNLLHLTGKNAVYMDTDSLIFKEPVDKPILRCSNYLGELTNELADYGEGARITEYCSAGPKDYYLRIQLPDGSEKHVRKVKGISLKYNNKEQTSGNALKDLIDGKASELQIKIVRKIERASGFEIFTVDGVKKLKLVYDKRARINQYETIPWGTVENAPEVVPDPSIEIEDWNIRDYKA